MAADFPKVKTLRDRSVRGSFSRGITCSGFALSLCCRVDCMKPAVRLPFAMQATKISGCFFKGKFSRSTPEFPFQLTLEGPFELTACHCGIWSMRCGALLTNVFGPCGLGQGLDARSVVKNSQDKLHWFDSWNSSFTTYSHLCPIFC